ncbi:MAG: DUF4446 family protein [Patescibacteria group bacterium]|nr:DUF4446 family protein [Patescibacteria group bacterium]
MILEAHILQWITLGLLTWLIILSVFSIRSIYHYNKLTKNITKKDLKKILSELMNQTNLNQKEINALGKSIDLIQTKIKSHIQKIGFIRFNPFPQTGGDQSFSLSLLDEKDTGFVLSSLHSRNATRFYAKTIKNGKAEDLKLSNEEKKAIKNAK